jgi:hypothetical protein
MDTLELVLCVEQSNDGLFGLCGEYYGDHCVMCYGWCSNKN